MAFGINFSFSLDPNHGFALSARPIAQAGEVEATVYRDLNNNGIRDPGEPLEAGAIVTTGTTQAQTPTDAHGSVEITGLAPFHPITVGVDLSSLSDPMLVPREALQVVVPRPGVSANVQIGLVGGGDVEGALIKNGDLGFEGVDLDLFDSSGKLTGTTRTDFDGFFLFERVAYGTYTIRVSKTSAAAAKSPKILEFILSSRPTSPWYVWARSAQHRRPISQRLGRQPPRNKSSSRGMPNNIGK